MNITEGNEIKEIVINYKDGTKKIVEKGMVSIFEQKGAEVSLNNELIDMSGEEYLHMLEAFVQIYGKINGLY